MPSSSYASPRAREVLTPSRRTATRTSTSTRTRVRPEFRRAASEEIVPDNVIDISELRRLRALEIERTAQESLRDVPRKNRASTKSTAKAKDKPRTPCAPCHWGLIVVTMLMALLSVPIIYSASQAIALDNHRSTDFFLFRQIGFVLLGITGLIAASRLPIQTMRSLLWVLYFASIAGLLATQFSPFGLTMGGTERWLKLGPIQLQVSELAKIALIGVLADFWSRAGIRSRLSTWPWIVSFMLALPIIGLVFKQPHLSAALVLFTIPIIIGFYAGASARHLAVIFGSIAVLGAVVIGLCSMKKMPLMKPYQQDRIAHFVSSSKDEQGAHYQTEQGLRAIERGGVLGVGPGASLFKQGHLPAPHTDFIFAIIGEEAGLVGMLFLLMCYGAIIFFCFQIGHVSGRPFEAMLCAGIGSLFALQVLCNMSVVLNIVPVTGMPLPLVSYGGSGLLCCLMALGLVLGVSRHNDQEEKAGA